MKELTRVQQINIAVGKLCWWTNIRSGEIYVWGTSPHGEDNLQLPDYSHDLNAAIEAAQTKLEGWDIIGRFDTTPPYSSLWFRWYKSGLHQVRVPDIETLPAAICEAILQAHGVTVDEGKVIEHE